MQLPANAAGEHELGALGTKAAKLLAAGDFSTLASTFGYALAFEREPALAIQQDLSACLATLEASALVPSATISKANVSYFEPNDTNLFALVMVRVSAQPEKAVLIELVVTGQGEEKHVYIEQLTAEA